MEEILAIFPARRVRWEILFLEVTNWKLIFSTERLIASRFEHKYFPDLLFPGPYYVYTRAGERKRAEIAKLSPESILRADEKNLEIPYSNVVSVCAFPNRFPSKSHIFMSLLLFTSEGLHRDKPKPDHVFSIPLKSKYMRDFEELLEGVLPRAFP